jgi:two-component system sensor histidine kinase KdpD
VLADAVLLDIVVTNLLDNAAIHGGPTAALEVGAVAAADGTIQLTVADGGPGVPLEALPTLFDRFRRVPRRTDGPRPGLGIGLSVVKGLIEAMGGSVAASSSALGGLAVTIALRAAPAGPDR